MMEKQPSTYFVKKVIGRQIEVCTFSQLLTYSNYIFIKISYDYFGS